MPPKKKSPKGDVKSLPKDLSSGVDMEAASIEELNQKISTLEKEKNKEEEYRNYMQLERDKINAFWEITKKDLDDKRAELRNKDREIEEMEERQQVEIKVYKQKVKHLLYEHQNNMACLTSEAEHAARQEAAAFQKESESWTEDMQSLKQQLGEHELADQEFLKQLKLEQAKEITKLRQFFELQFRQLKELSEKKMKRMREECELRRKAEVHEIEERKNRHINNLMNNHERAFYEIKNYYNDITHNNLDLIKTLKEDVAEMKKKEVQNEKLMYEIAQENKRLSDPLNAALKEVESLRHQLANYEEAKRALSGTKGRLSHAQKEIKNLEWEREVLQQKLERVTKERDEEQSKQSAEMFEWQQRAGLKQMHIEKSCQALQQELAKREAQVAEIMIAANLDTPTVTQINTRLEEILNAKDAQIRTLQLDLARTTKARGLTLQQIRKDSSHVGAPRPDAGLQGEVGGSWGAGCRSRIHLTPSGLSSHFPQMRTLPLS